MRFNKFLISNQSNMNLIKLLTQLELKPELPRSKILKSTSQNLVHIAFPVRTTVLGNLHLHNVTRNWYKLYSNQLHYILNYSKKP